MRLDTVLFNVIHGFAGSSKFLDWTGIFLADYLGYFLILGFIVIFIRHRYSLRFLAFTILVFLLSRGIFVEVFRFAFPRMRPFLELDFAPLITPPSGWAYPSGHATVFFAIAFALWIVNRKWSVWFLAAAVLMGIARVFVGVHWPADILAGALTGFLSVIVVEWLLPISTLKGEQTSESFGKSSKQA